MAEDNHDDKTGTESSTAPSAATTSQDDKQQTADSSAAATTTTQTEETLADVVQKAADASLAKEAGADGEGQDKSLTEKEEKTEVTKEATEVKTEDKPVVEAERDKDVPKKYSDDPAWQRIIKERNEAETRLKGLEAPLRFATGITKYCQERGITDQQFQQALEFVSLANSDPRAALAKLTPIVEQLSEVSGSKLPADLQKKVTEGVLDPETAAEVARLRADQKFGTARAQTEAQRQHAAVVSSMVQNLNAWDKNKRATDVDFDKKSELVRSRFLSLYQAMTKDGQPVNPVRSAADAVALAERAYADVQKSIEAFIPAKPAKRVLPSNGASTKTTKSAPGTMREAVAAMLREKYESGLEE